MNRFLIWLALTLVPLAPAAVLGQPKPAPVPAQPAGPAAPDTTVFTAADFYQAIVRYHPLVRLARTLPEGARLAIQEARGAFDPKLGGSYDRKHFNDQLYFDKWYGGLTVPVAPGGIDLKAGYEQASGKYLNPESTVPTAGLASVGLKVPLGPALLIDARRNALRQAQLGTTLADADRLKQINKVLFDAAKTYWDWARAYQQYQLLRAGYQVADTRFLAVRNRSLIGDVAPIDTTEALITVQDRQVQLQQAAVDLANNRLRVVAYLWTGSDAEAQPRPVDLAESVVPEAGPAQAIDSTLLANLLDRAASAHPDLVKLTVKGQQLQLDTRYKRSLLFPKIALQASLLSAGPVSDLEVGTPYGFRADNHKVSLDLAFPLLLRAERSQYQQARLKTRQLDLERQQTSRSILNEVQASWNTLQALNDQLRVQELTVLRQRQLVTAEQQKFALGESSLFLVNTRETKLIDLELKLAELRAKYQQSVAALWYAAGTAQLPIPD
ncbi:TolC family protein [Spirosoma luteolum]